MNKNVTGYPSIDRPWLKYYKENAESEANNIPENKTVWDVIEEPLHKYENIPECRIAIVYDQMWENVSCEFTKDRFETVIIARITDAMNDGKKLLVSALSGIKNKVDIPKEEKYISVVKARKLANEYDGEVRFVRIIFCNMP